MIEKEQIAEILCVSPNIVEKARYSKCTGFIILTLGLGRIKYISSTNPNYNIIKEYYETVRFN